MPPTNDEPFAMQDPGRRGRGNRMFNINVGGRQTNTQSIGTGINFDLPGVNKFTAEIRGLETALQQFKKTVADVGQYLSSHGSHAFNSPIQGMADQYKNLTRSINEAVLASNNAKGIIGGNAYNAATSSADPAVSQAATRSATGGLPTSSAAVGGGRGGFTAANDVSNFPTQVSVDDGAGGAVSTAKSIAGHVPVVGQVVNGNGGSGSTISNGALKSSTVSAALSAGLNLAIDNRNAALLMADVLGPTAVAARTNIQALIGTIAQNLAVYGPITEQLAAINVGTQIGAAVPAGKTPFGSGATQLGGMAGFGLGMELTGTARAAISVGKDVLSGLKAGPFGGSSIDDLKQQAIARSTAQAQAIAQSKTGNIDNTGMGTKGPNAAGSSAIGNRTGGFYQGVREMQAITPGVGAGTIASQFASYISDTGAQQRGMVLGMGAFTSFGKGAQIKSFSDWAKAITEFFKQQRPGADRGKAFTYAELVTQNFPGSNINAWFDQMGVPAGLVFYWWQYVMSSAPDNLADSPFQAEMTAQTNLSQNLAAQRLQALSQQGRGDLSQAFTSYPSYIKAEKYSQVSGKFVNQIKQFLSSAGQTSGISDAEAVIQGFNLQGVLQGLGGRAAGESVYKGQPVRTSELGSEIFVPKEDGDMITASKTRRLDALLDANQVPTSGPTLIFNTTLNMGAGANQIEAKRAATVLVNHHQTEIRRQLTRMSG